MEAWTTFLFFPLEFLFANDLVRRWKKKVNCSKAGSFFTHKKKNFQQVSTKEREFFVNEMIIAADVSEKEKREVCLGRDNLENALII